MNEINKEKIYKRFKQEVAISNFENEEITNQYSQRKGVKIVKRFKVLNIAAVLLVVMLIGIVTPSIYAKIQWDIQFEDYQRKNIEISTTTVADDEQDGYVENLNMDYITQDGVGVKVDSLILTDDSFNAKISFNFDDDIIVDSKAFRYSFAVYDEENNIYGIIARSHVGEKKEKYTPYIFKALGIKCSEDDMYSEKYRLHDTAQYGTISATDRNVVSEIELVTTRNFPKSKKIYIRITDLGFTMKEFEYVDNRPKKVAEEEFLISSSEWIFEIELPEKFYDRQTVSLKILEEIPKIKFNKIEITEMGLVVNGEYDEMENYLDKLAMSNDRIEIIEMERNFMYITDEEGNRYNSAFSEIGRDNIAFSLQFEIGKKMLEKKLFLNHSINGKTYTRELVTE